MEIDIEDFIDEASTKTLIRELESRGYIIEDENMIKEEDSDNHTINDFKTDIEKRKFLCYILELNEFDNNNKERIFETINNLF